MYLPVKQSMTFNLLTTIIDWDLIAKAKTLSRYMIWSFMAGII